MTRAQKIIRNLSFESKNFDIYNPEFSSDDNQDIDEDEDERLFASEEAKGKICDERLSELNPCGDGDSIDSHSSTSHPNIHPDLLSQALSIGHDKTTSNSAQSNKTEMERCPLP